MKRSDGLIWLSILVALLCCTSVQAANLLVLESGKTLRASSYYIVEDTVHVSMNEKSAVAIPLSWVREIRTLPDPIPVAPVVEVASAAPDNIQDLQYSDLIVSLSKKHEIDWKLVAAVMYAESNFNPRAVSPKGALGLMQLMPATAKMYRVTDPYDPVQNIDAGVRHLKMLLGRFPGKVDLALAAYNAGEKSVDRFKGIPPFSETRSYVKKVLHWMKGLSS